MDLFSFLDNELYKVIALVVFIFLARAADVALATLRFLFASRGYQKLASLVGFFESLLWLVIIQQVMSNMSHWVNAVAYAGGFSAGTYIGIAVEKKLSLGDILVRIIISGNNSEISNILRKNGFAVTEINASGRDGDVTLMYSLIPRSHFTSVKTLLDGFDSSIMYTAEDIRLVKGSGKRWKINPPIRY